jgi:2-octaprenylphenol hydroxylase
MSKEKSNKFDVIIVGGGMVGLSTALLLARNFGELSPLKLALIDGQKNTHTKSQKKAQKVNVKESTATKTIRAKQKAKTQTTEAKVNSFNPRVSALTLASESLFDSLGLWQKDIARHACPYEDMYVWDAEGTGNINFSALDIQQSALGHIVENTVISEALQTALAQSINLQQFKESQVNRYQAQAEHHTLSLADGTELHGKLIIAADGANSFIRQEAAFEVKAWSYQHQAIVTTVRTEKSHNFTASQCFLASGPLAFLPLLDTQSDNKNQFYSSIVWSCEPDKAQKLMDMDQATFHAALQEAFENKLGHISESAKRIAFPLWQRHATSYVKPGLALIGDAAHTIHPLAGQGVNLGLADAECLYKVIKQAWEKGEDFSSEQVLSRYQRQRIGHNLSMMALMEVFKRGFASDDLGLRWLRNVGLDVVDKASPIKHQLMKKAMGF